MIDVCREPHSQSQERFLLTTYQEDENGTQVSITSVTGHTLQLKVTQRNIESKVRQSGLFHIVFFMAVVTYLTPSVNLKPSLWFWWNETGCVQSTME